jgi:hypothetical protein
MRAQVFPEAFLRSMSAEDRRAIGQMTMAEAQERYERGEEKKLKADVINWLNLQNVWIFTQPMNKRTRGKRGVPDIIGCCRGRFVAIELKAAGGRLEPAQTAECERIREAGGIVIVAYSLRDVMEGLWKARKIVAAQKAAAQTRPPPPRSMPAVRAANSDGQGAALVTDSVSRRLPRGVKGSCKPRRLGNAPDRLARICLSHEEFVEWIASRKEVPS